MSKVGVVARALYAKSWMATQTGPNAPTWDIKADPGAEQWRVMARAAIEAMRKPTDTMLDRGYEQSGPIDGAIAFAVVGEIWCAMVDGALTDEASGRAKP